MGLVCYCLTGIPVPESLENYDLDANDNLTEEEFEEVFGLDPVTDEEEKARREAALEAVEKEVKEENEKYLNGEAEWWEEINEWSDLPMEEFQAQKTGEKEMDLSASAPQQSFELETNVKCEKTGRRRTEG